MLELHFMRSAEAPRSLVTRAIDVLPNPGVVLNHAEELVGSHTDSLAHMGMLAIISPYLCGPLFTLVAGVEGGIAVLNNDLQHEKELPAPAAPELSKFGTVIQTVGAALLIDGKKSRSPLSKVIGGTALVVGTAIRANATRNLHREQKLALYRARLRKSSTKI